MIRRPREAIKTTPSSSILYIPIFIYRNIFLYKQTCPVPDLVPLTAGLSQKIKKKQNKHKQKKNHTFKKEQIRKKNQRPFLLSKK